MAKIVRKQEVQPLEPGLHHVVIGMIVDLGIQKPHPAAENQEPRMQYTLGLEFPGLTGSDSKPRTTWLVVNESLNPKSSLGKIIAAAGITVGDEFDLDELLDANLTVLVEHTEKDGKTYGNIVGYAPLTKGITKVKAVRRDAQPPEWIQRKIAARLDKVTEPSAGADTTKPNVAPLW